MEMAKKKESVGTKKSNAATKAERSAPKTKKTGAAKAGETWDRVLSAVRSKSDFDL